MYKTLASAMFWEGMEKDINWYVKRCSTCQKYKKTQKKNGKLPPKYATMIPWGTVCVDLVWLYTATDNTGKDRTLMAMTFIDPVMGWFEITKLPEQEKSSTRISQLVNTTWLGCYPRPKKVIFDN